MTRSVHAATFTLVDTNPDVLALFLGNPLPMEPTFSLTYDTIQQVPAEPRKPSWPGIRGLFRYYSEYMLWRRAHERWVEQGSPQYTEATIRTCIPRATIKEVSA